MTAKGSASPLASFAAQWIGADIRGLHALATTLYGYRPEITGVTTTLNQEVSQLTGGGQGWRGPAASAFSAAWRRDAAAAEALAFLRQILGGPAGSIAGVAAAAVAQAGLGHLSADPPDDTAGRDHSARHLWDSLL